MAQSDSDGTFALREILPGKFLLMAIENGWNLEWTNPAVLKPFRERGDVIEIVPGDAKNVAVNVQRRYKNTPLAVAGHSHTLIRTIPLNPINARSSPIFPRSMLIPFRFTLWP